MEPRRTILLIDNSADSEKAADLLTFSKITFEILKADAFWKEIDFPVPSLFREGEIWKGLENIKVLVEIINELTGPN